ncbi:hypothetical protein VPHK567_0243 [Vibrio phage K567]
MNKLIRAILWLFIQARWAYFHISPSYKKFYMIADEAHFQHLKRGTIHSNLSLRDANDVSS